MRARLAAAAAAVLAGGAWLVAAWREPAPVRVFAAASLGGPLQALAAELEPRGVRVELSLAGTQVLRTQIEHGAAADVYAFADIEEARALHARGLVEPPRVLARAAVCVAIPSGGRVRSLADLAAPGTKIVLAAPSVPAGRYARRALERMGSVPGLGARYREKVLANVVSEETNVRLVVAKVALGEADAGFVYETDVLAEADLAALPLPPPAAVSAEYGIGLVSAGASEAARAFVSAALGPPGRRILAARGFGLP